MANILQMDLLANQLTCRILDEFPRPENSTDDEEVLRDNKQSYNAVSP